MNRVNDIDEKIKGLQDEIKDLRKQKKEAAKRITFRKCDSCNKRTTLKKLDYIQTYWYVEPHG